jgi:hypothetical protein
MFYCVPDSQNPNKPGFHLIEMSNSRVPDFGGLKLTVVKKIATSKGIQGTWMPWPLIKEGSPRSKDLPLSDSKIDLALANYSADTLLALTQN